MFFGIFNDFYFSLLESATVQLGLMV